jgi:hypothetical protein
LRVGSPEAAAFAALKVNRGMVGGMQGSRPGGPLHSPLRSFVLAAVSLAMSRVGSAGSLPGDRDASSPSLSFVGERRPEPPPAFFAIHAVDPSVIFINNSPENGCGQ